MLEEYLKEKDDPARQAELLAKADKRLRPIVSDPRIEALELWRLAGIIASKRKDAELAAFAFEAIERIKPGYAADDQLINIMGRLDAMEIEKRVAEIRGARADLLKRVGLAGLGDLEAMYLVGLNCAWTGRGLIAHTDTAMKWCGQAANSGHVEAMNEMGLLERHYRLDESDGQRAERGQRAVAWFRRAIDAGSARAKASLAECHDSGLSPDERRKLFRDAIDAGIVLTGNQVNVYGIHLLLHGEQSAEMATEGLRFLERNAFREDLSSVIKGEIWYAIAVSYDPTASPFDIRHHRPIANREEAIIWYRRLKNDETAVGSHGDGFLQDLAAKKLRELES